MNRLSMNRLSMNRLSMNRLSMNRLSMNGLLDPATGEAGAEVIKYSARCMLRTDQSVQVDYVDASGASRSDIYYGLLGLEPTWLDSDTGLSDAGKRWWAGCMVAHATSLATPTSVSISVRSDTHAALAASRTEARSFPNQQGAFWGGYDPTAPEGEEFSFYTCKGSKFDAVKASRFCCYEGHTCGDLVTYIGKCEASAASMSAACESLPDGNVDRCHASLSSTASWPDAASREAMTVYLPK
jgi:hypothetical protein